MIATCTKLNGNKNAYAPKSEQLIAMVGETGLNNYLLQYCSECGQQKSYSNFMSSFMFHAKAVW